MSFPTEPEAVLWARQTADRQTAQLKLQLDAFWKRAMHAD
jgi:hypothetical protein